MIGFAERVADYPLIVWAVLLGFSWVLGPLVVSGQARGLQSKG